MQQIFLFFIMLITASEAFLNGSYISTSNKKKISGFVPNARILKSVKFGNMDFPRKIDTEPGIISPRERSTFLNLCARHKRFSNGDTTGLKNLDNVSFLRTGKYLKKRRNSSRRLRSMRRKRKPTSSFPKTKTINMNSHPGSENSSLPSVISVFDSPVNSNKFYGKALCPKSRSKVVKKKQIKDLSYPPFNSKQPFKYSNLRIKRHGRMESRNVKKHKRDAEAVNVSQANVTKDANEKNLDEESNDSLDDSYSQDLRPKFATQHHDTPSNWQKYLKLNSQLVSPYFLPSMPDGIDYYDSVLDIPPRSLFVPRMSFRIPYDRKIYEDTNFEDDQNDAKFFRKSESEDIIEKKKSKKKKDKVSESYRLDKLKHLLDDVENALKEENCCSKSKMMRKGIRGGGRLGDSEDSIRAKINIVIPLLSQISQDLGKKSTQLQRIAAESKSNILEKEDGEGKEVKGNKKKCLECSLNGVWFSNIMGLQINVTTQHNLMLKVTLKSFKRDAIIDDTWSMHGLSLSKTEGPFILAAICPEKRKIASFMGQCWMCEDEEYVYGSWTIYTKEEKITDLLTAVDTKLDVLTRKKGKEEVT